MIKFKNILKEIHIEPYSPKIDYWPLIIGKYEFNAFSEPKLDFVEFQQVRITGEVQTYSLATLKNQIPSSLKLREVLINYIKKKHIPYTLNPDSSRSYVRVNKKYLNDWNKQLDSRHPRIQ